MEETIRKIYVRELKENDVVHTVFKVTKKAKQTSRSGKTYLMLTFGDKTGEVEARVFDNVDGVEPTFLEGDFVLIKGKVILWQKKPQIVVETVERLDPEPIDPAEFAVPPPAPAPQLQPQAQAQEAMAPAASPQKTDKPERADRPERPADGHRAVQQIKELVDRVHDHHVKALLQSFMEDEDLVRGLATAPAAKGVHHAYKGGLAEHILSVMKLAHRIADQYPMADRDLLIAGALLHDIYKVKEILPDKGGGFEYSDEGRLVGHLVMAAQEVHLRASRISGFPKALEHHITHIVLAHHGQLDWGSPKEPMTLEALLVHLIDTVDSRVASWLEIMERDPGEKWTDSKNLYGRHLWKAPPPTSRGRHPLDGRPARKRNRQKSRGPERAPHSAAVAAATAGVPTFKPLEEISKAAAPAPEEPRQTAEQPPSGE